jgi:hypothetical protein
MISWKAAEHKWFFVSNFSVANIMFTKEQNALMINDSTIRRMITNVEQYFNLPYILSHPTYS